MISAKIIADSISKISGDRITTMMVVMPRYILAEFNTHRMFSRNSASSRAIPFEKMVQSVIDNPFIPIAWQKDHSGMQGTEYFNDELATTVKYPSNKTITQECDRVWLEGRDWAVTKAKELNQGFGATKQMANRMLEAYMWHTVLVTASEWENFWTLRCPQYEFSGEVSRSWKDFLKINDNIEEDYGIVERLWCNKGQADIHMMAVAEAMWDAYNESTPKELSEGEWHIPFGDNINSDDLLEKSRYGYDNGGLEEQSGWLHEGGEVQYYKDLSDLKVKIAIARCARLSYKTLGDDKEHTYEQDLVLFDRLAKSGHWSPFEHCARAMSYDEAATYYFGKAVEANYTELVLARNDTKLNKAWCRNFRGFIQYRALIDNNNDTKQEG